MYLYTFLNALKLFNKCTLGLQVRVEVKSIVNFLYNADQVMNMEVIKKGGIEMELWLKMG